MQRTQFEQLIAHVSTQFALLTEQQRDLLLGRLRHISSQSQVAALIDQARLAQLSCPACHSDQYYRHGRAHGLQRYRCRSCGRTYNGLTGTPLAHLQYKARWLDYARCMLDSTSVRAAARQVAIDRTTSFRWRHRFMELARSDRPRCLHGIAEADEMFLLESEKGSRHMTRPARKRGGNAGKRGISGEQVCILVARDRTGQTLDFVTGKGALTKAQLHTCLLPVIDRDLLLVTDGNAAYRAFAREAGISHEAVNLRAGIRTRGALHVQNVNAYHSRFRGWLQRFHGVATAYLPNYLGWRWILDAGRIGSVESFLRASLGDFPHLMRT